MRDTIICSKEHNFEEANGDIIISAKEFIYIIRCLTAERNAICEDCGKCEECSRILVLIKKYREIEHKVREKANNYIVLLKFNKTKTKLELEYTRVFSSFMEAGERKVFLV